MSYADLMPFLVAGWVLFFLAVWWYRGQMKLSQARRQDLCCYVILLVLDDQIREQAKGKFHEWIRKKPVESPMALALEGQLVVEDIAERMSNNSIMYSTALLAKVKWPEQIAKGTAEASPAS